MKKSKAILMALCAVLLVAASVMGTLAYLTSTDEVVNTFTVGKVKITLDEAKVNVNGQKLNVHGDVYAEDGSVELAARVQENDYKLMPGHEYVKDPIVHVDKNSENCYLFVKVVNEIDTIEAAPTIADQMKANGWTRVSGTSNVYAYKDVVSAGANVDVFKTFTISGTVTNDDLAGTPAVEGPDSVITPGKPGYKDAQIVVTAYAIQADGFSSAAEAWGTAGSSF